ncbi:mammalian ependymin-related protein 1 isoform X2 [Ictidomys tridecemlineatus]
MSGRVPLRAASPLGAWLLGGLWVWALGGLCSLGTAGSPGSPHPCQAPQQWEGRQVLYQQSSGRNSRALLSYDGLNQRVRVLDERKALIPCKRWCVDLLSHGFKMAVSAPGILSLPNNVQRQQLKEAEWDKRQALLFDKGEISRGFLLPADHPLDFQRENQL